MGVLVHHVALIVGRMKLFNHSDRYEIREEAFFLCQCVLNRAVARIALRYAHQIFFGVSAVAQKDRIEQQLCHWILDLAVVSAKDRHEDRTASHRPTKKKSDGFATEENLLL